MRARWSHISSRLHTPFLLLGARNCKGFRIAQALMIAQLYRDRWQVELFFRWIKQPLRRKAFYGIAEHAVEKAEHGPVGTG